MIGPGLRYRRYVTINGNDYDDEYEVNEHAKKHLVIDSGLGILR